MRKLRETIMANFIIQSGLSMLSLNEDRNEDMNYIIS